MVLLARPRRVAMISVHTSPLSRLGGRDAGGMNVYVAQVATHLARLGEPVDLFTRRVNETGPAVQEIADGVRLIAVAAGPPAPLAKEEIVPYLPQFAAGMEGFRRSEGLAYDIVHSHYWLSGEVARRLQRLWQAAHVTMFHTLGEAKNRARFTERESVGRITAEQRIAYSADRVVCASPDERSILARYYGIPADRVSVIPCGVDVDLFRPLDKEACRRAIGVQERFVILYVGRLEPLKGIDILIRACGQLSPDLDFRLLIVGGDEGSAGRVEALRRQAEAVGIAERVTFAGAAPQAALPAYYSAADICAVPSYYESFGLVALEAMACGTAVLASRVGGLSSTIRDGETGYLVSWRCPEPFAERVETLLRNEELLRRFGAAARERAESFRWETVAGLVAGLYGELRGRRPKAAPHPEVLNHYHERNGIVHRHLAARAV